MRAQVILRGEESYSILDEKHLALVLIMSVVPTTITADHSYYRRVLPYVNTSYNSHLALITVLPIAPLFPSPSP